MFAARFFLRSGVAARRSPTRVNKKPRHRASKHRVETHFAFGTLIKGDVTSLGNPPPPPGFFFPTSSRSYARATLPLLPTLVGDHPKAINQHDCVISCGGFFCGGNPMTTILFFVERIMITRCFVAGQDAGLALVLKLFSYISENMYIGNFIYI